MSNTQCSGPDCGLLQKEIDRGKGNGSISKYLRIVSPEFAEFCLYLKEGRQISKEDIRMAIKGIDKTVTLAKKWFWKFSFKLWIS